MALEISTDRARLNRDTIHDYLCNQSYWARGRPREITERAIEGSLCFGAYDGGELVGFGRVVTDAATFGYVADVFVVPARQGQGIGKALVAAMLDHPDMQGLRRLMLATEDAHSLYQQFGFTAIDDVPKWLQLRRAPRPTTESR